MHRSGDVERLAATDFHVPRRIHGKLKNRDSGQLQLLKNSGGEILWAGGVFCIGHHRVSRDIRVKVGIGRIYRDIADRSPALHISLARVPARVIELPCAPISGIRRRGHRVLAIGVQLVDDQTFATIQEVPVDLAHHFFRGRFRRRDRPGILDGTVCQPGAAGRP